MFDSPILTAVGYLLPLVSHKALFIEQTLIVSNNLPQVLLSQPCWAFTIYCYCFAFREAMLLGLASAAVQRASAGRSGRSCQQADGQVCGKVSTEMIFPVRHSKTMVGKSWALIVRWSIFTHSDWGGGWQINHISLDSWSRLLTGWNTTEVFNGALPVKMADTAVSSRGGRHT